MKKLWILKLQSFEKALEKLEELSKKENLNEVERDACVQRFEFSFELCWKTLKTFIHSEGFSQAVSPKEVLKLSFQLNILENEKIWLEMLESRNLLSHTYNESFAQQSLEQIQKNYAPALRKLWHTLSKKES